MEFAHEFRVGHPMSTGPGIDSLDPEGPETGFFLPPVAIGVGKSLLVSILGDCPDILLASEVPFGLFDDFFPVPPGGDGIG